MERSQHDIAESQFGARADAYVTSAVHAVGEDLDRVERIAAHYPAARALDLGTGGGHIAYRIAPHVASVVACDLSAGMLSAVAAEAARRGIGNITTRQAPAERLPFADAAFDFLACRMTTHHWQDMDAGLREARRVLTADAPAIFIDVVSPAHPMLDTHLQAVELLRDTSHVRDYRMDEWTSALGRAGFVVQAAHVHDLRLSFASWVERMRTPDAHVAAIRSLQAAATDMVQNAFAIAPDGSFTIQIATFETRAA